jgi:hypothetical protein
MKQHVRNVIAFCALTYTFIDKQYRTIEVNENVVSIAFMDRRIWIMTSEVAFPPGTICAQARYNL